MSTSLGLAGKDHASFYGTDGYKATPTLLELAGNHPYITGTDRQEGTPY